MSRASSPTRSSPWRATPRASSSRWRAKPPATRRESLLHIHVPRIDTPEARERLRAGLEHVYADVALAVDDWAAMRGRITEVIQAYRANPPPLPEDEIAEALQFLEWIAGDNFTLLGIRAYRFPGGDV